MTAAIDPLLLVEVDLLHGEAAAGEQQVLLVQQADEFRIAGEIHRQGPGAVSVVGEQLVARLEITAGPGLAPPAGGHTDLRIRAGHRHIEGLGLETLPDVGRELVDAFLAGRVQVAAFQAEAVDAVPVGFSGGTVVLPDDILDRLPVTAATALVIQLGQVDLFPVIGEELTDPGPFENLLRDVQDHGTRALAVEDVVLEDKRVAVRVEQLGAADELEVRAEDGQLLTAGEFFAVHLGETGNDRVTDGHVLLGLRLVIRGADDELAAGGGNARGRGQADHAVADMLDVGDADPAGEHDLADVRHAGSVHGHRLAGHDLRREEHLDAQAGGVQLVDFLGSTCCGEAQEGDGQHHSDMIEYLLHN